MERNWSNFDEKCSLVFDKNTTNKDINRNIDKWNVDFLVYKEGKYKYIAKDIDFTDDVRTEE